MKNLEKMALRVNALRGRIMFADDVIADMRDGIRECRTMIEQKISAGYCPGELMPLIREVAEYQQTIIEQKQARARALDELHRLDFDAAVNGISDAVNGISENALDALLLSDEADAIISDITGGF